MKQLHLIAMAIGGVFVASVSTEREASPCGRRTPDDYYVDQPHLYFMHFWANDDARKLADGLKAALAHINIAKSCACLCGRLCWRQA